MFTEAARLAREVRNHHELIELEGDIGACLLKMGKTAQARKRFVRAIAAVADFAEQVLFTRQEQEEQPS